VTLTPRPRITLCCSQDGVATQGRMFHAFYNLPMVHLRVFMVYGPRHRTSLSSSESPTACCEASSLY
jgi:hypothetical protein